MWPFVARKYIMKKIKLTLNDQDIEIKQMPLYQYTEVLKALNELPAKIGDFTNISSDEIFKRIPSLIATGMPELVQILSIATEIPVLDLQAMPLDDVVQIAIAVYEVNNYRDIFDRLKKAASPPIPTSTLKAK